MATQEKRSLIARIFGGIWFVLKSYFISVGLFFTLVFASFFVIVMQKQKEPAKFNLASEVVPKQESILEIELSGHVSNRFPRFGDFFEGLFERRRIYSIAEMRHTLQFAATDEKIKGIFIQVGAMEADASTLADLRRILQWYKTTAKKPVYFHMDSVESNHYLLASIADLINVPKSGDLSLFGPTMQLVYFGKAMEKLGIGFNVVKVGKYKSAFEPFVQNQPSAETLEEYVELEKSLRNAAIEEIAAARKQKPEAVALWFKESLYLPHQARTSQIIDSNEYIGDFKEKIKTDLKVSHFVDYDDYEEYTADRDTLIKSAGGSDGIALIEAYGNITMDETNRDDDGITPHGIIPQLQWARKENKVKAIVLRINSGGGSALASDLIWDEVLKTSKVKPVIASFADVAASGGYYIASSASHIIAEPRAITGSIGVIGLLPNLKQFSEKYGIDFYTINDSKHQALVDMGKTPSKEDLEKIQSQTDYVYQQFIERVALGRRMQPEKVHEIGQGRVWTGQQATKIGLVDELGGLQDAYQAAKKLAKLDVNLAYPVLRYKKPPVDFFDCLNQGADSFECLNELKKGAQLGSSWQQLLPTPLKALMAVTPMQEKDIAASSEQVLKMLELTKHESVLALWPHRRLID